MRTQLSDEDKDRASEAYASFQRNQPPDMERAIKAGLIRKADLVDGAYYGGTCRNASCARWVAEFKCFVHQRWKFGAKFPETIGHPEDDTGFDIFACIKRIEPQPEEIVTDEEIAGMRKFYGNR